MRNLKILLCLLSNSVESLNLTFAALASRYGTINFDIVGVIGGSKLFFQGRELKNILPSNVSETSFDYIIAVGSLFNPANVASLKKILAEKINAPSESIVFDFEICSGKISFPKVCLVVVFNHRFDRNLPLLRKIYGERFSDVRFLMPFYDGTDADVIPVYESSFQFQGYFIQAYDKLKDIPCTHYLFVGDDLIINPAFDETNLVGRINMYDKKFACPTFTPLNSSNKFRWHWSALSSKPFYDTAIQWKSSLCSYEEAMTKFNDFFGERYKETYDKAFFGNPNEPGGNLIGSWNDAQGFFNVVNYFIMTNRNSLKIPYPMAGGYSDIFCLDKESLLEFSRLCGIFSSMNMFVEIAIPTAVVLTYKKIDVKFFPDNSMLILWDNDRIDFENKYENDFSRMYNEWNEKNLCVHPVKLSRWKNI